MSHSSTNSPRQYWSTSRLIADSIASIASSREVFAVEDLLAAPVDDLALLVHHLVVLEHVLADLEVATLDRALRALDRLRDHLRLERHVVGERLVHHALT